MMVSMLLCTSLVTKHIIVQRFLLVVLIADSVIKYATEHENSARRSFKLMVERLFLLMLLERT
ncbi:hypothetical protein AK965_17085 [Vibrio sp. PID17_43]|nr:hypothetical protein AK965_17085 [Vibrio sp. PID17_43]